MTRVNRFGDGGVIRSIKKDEETTMATDDKKTDANPAQEARQKMIRRLLQANAGNGQRTDEEEAARADAAKSAREKMIARLIAANAKHQKGGAK